MGLVFITTLVILLTLGAIVGMFALLAAERPFHLPRPDSPRIAAIKEQMRMAGLALQPVVSGPKLVTHYKGERILVKVQSESKRSAPSIQIVMPLPVSLRFVRLVIADASAFRGAAFEIGAELLNLQRSLDGRFVQPMPVATDLLENTFRLAGLPGPALEAMLAFNPPLRQALLQTPPGLLLWVTDRSIVISPGVNDMLGLYPAEWQSYFELARLLKIALVRQFSVPNLKPREVQGVG